MARWMLTDRDCKYTHIRKLSDQRTAILWFQFIQFINVLRWLYFPKNLEVFQGKLPCHFSRIELQQSDLAFFQQFSNHLVWDEGIRAEVVFDVVSVYTRHRAPEQPTSPHTGQARQCQPQRCKQHQDDGRMRSGQLY